MIKILLPDEYCEDGDCKCVDDGCDDGCDGGCDGGCDDGCDDGCECSRDEFVTGFTLLLLNISDIDDAVFVITEDIGKFILDLKE